MLSSYYTSLRNGISEEILSRLAGWLLLREKFCYINKEYKIIGLFKSYFKELYK